MIKGRASTREKLTNKLKRTQSAEVHNVSERRRRDRIKGNVRALQELMPHCKKKDRASILEDAAEYIKTLKLQFNMMTKPAEAECLAPYTSCSQNPVMQFPNLSSFVPMGPGIGMGSGMAYGAGMLGLGFYAQSAPLIQVPVLGLSPSAVAGFPFPTICAPRVVESTTVNSSGETGAFCEPNPTRVFGSYTAAATCSSSGLGADGLSLRKKRRNIY